MNNNESCFGSPLGNILKVGCRIVKRVGGYNYKPYKSGIVYLPKSIIGKYVHIKLLTKEEEKELKLKLKNAELYKKERYEKMVKLNEHLEKLQKMTGKEAIGFHAEVVGFKHETKGLTKNDRN